MRSTSRSSTSTTTSTSATTRTAAALPRATLYLGRLTAVRTSGEWGKDDVFMEVWEIDEQGNPLVKLARWPNNNGTIAMGNGGVAYTDIALNVDYDAKVEIRVRERDSSSNDDANSTVLLARYRLDRRSVPSATISDDSGPKKTLYSLEYRILSNPIPTVRILGIKCEKQTDDMDGETSGAILGALSTCCGAASEVIDMSPRPRAKAIAAAFDAAGNVLDGIAVVAGWLAKRIEGKDDVYLVHYTNSSASQDIDARFFPIPKPNEEKTKHMEAENAYYFETEYGEYFRFPVDKEDVIIEFREHDEIGKDISICTVTVPRITSSTDPRLGAAAVCEVGCTYDMRNDDKGGVYHLCYAIGMDDWSLPANSDVQGDAMVDENSNGYTVPDLTTCDDRSFYRFRVSGSTGDFLGASAEGTIPTRIAPDVPFNPMELDAYWMLERVGANFEDFRLLNSKHRRHLTVAEDHVALTLVLNDSSDVPEKHWKMTEHQFSTGADFTLIPLVEPGTYLATSSSGTVRLEKTIGGTVPWTLESLGTRISTYCDKRFRLMHAATGLYLTIENGAPKLARFQCNVNNATQIFEPRRYASFNDSYLFLCIVSLDGDDASQKLLTFKTALSFEPFTAPDSPARYWHLEEAANKAGFRLRSMNPDDGRSLYWRDGVFGLSAQEYGHDLWVAHFETP